MPSIIEKAASLGGEQIYLGPILEDRAAFARRALATALVRPVAELSPLGAYERTLAALLDIFRKDKKDPNALIAPTASTFLVISENLVHFLLAMANRLQLHQAISLVKALKSMWDLDALDAAIQEATPAGTTVSGDALRSVLFTLLEGDGSLIQPNSQMEMAELGLRVLDASITSDGTEPVHRYLFLVAAGAWIDTQLILAESVTRKSEGEGILTEEIMSRAAARRVQAMRNAANMLSDRVIAGHLRVARALFTWLDSPPVKLALSGRTAESTQRALTWADSRLKPLEGKYPPGWQLFTRQGFDSTLLGAWGIMKDLPIGLRGGASGPDVHIGGGALLNDVLYEVEIGGDSGDAWTSAMWAHLEAAEQAHAALIGCIGDAATTRIRAVPPVPEPTLGEPTMPIQQIRPLAGLPLLTELDMHVRAPNLPETMREQGFSAWVLQTYVDYLAHFRERMPWVPALVEGPAGTCLVPVVEGVDDYERQGDFSELGIARALRTTVRRLAETVWTYGSPSSLGLRALADSLSHLGVLHVAAPPAQMGDKTTRPDAMSTVVRPTAGYYYHANELGSDLFDLTKQVKLGKLSSGEELWFVPFEVIPDSVRADHFEDNINLYQKTDGVPVPRFYVRWLAEKAARSALKIVGWRRHEREVSDVVLLRSCTTGYRGCAVLLSGSGTFEGARAYNAIVSLMGPDETWTPIATSPVRCDMLSAGKVGTAAE